MSLRKKGISALFLLTIIWGSFGLPIRFLSDHFSLFQQIYLRLIVATVLTALFFYNTIRWKNFLHIPKKEWIILLFRVIVLYGFAVTLYTQAFTLTTFGHVSLIGAIPTTAVLGFILLREKITLPKVAFILLSVIGVFVITVKDPSQMFSWGSGDVVALIADFFFSLSYISRKWQANYLNNQELAVLMLFFGCILVFAMSLFIDQSLPSLSHFSTVTSLVFIGAGVLNAASLFLTNYGFAYVEASLASNIIALESFFAILFGYLFYGELLTLQTFLGGMLILTSVVFLNKEEVKNGKK